MINPRKKTSIYSCIAGCLVLIFSLSCKKIDDEIDRQNAESGIVSFSPENALLGDTVLVYLKTGSKDANVALKIGGAEVQVLGKTSGTSSGKDIEIWKIIIPKNAPFGQPPAELIVNGQRKPAYYGIVLNEPPALIEGKVTASLFAGIFRKKEYNECGYESNYYPAKDGPLLQAQFGVTSLVAYSQLGNILYVVDNYYPYLDCAPDPEHTKTLIRKIQNGMVSTVAGGGNDPNGDGRSALLPVIKGMAVSPSGVLFLSVLEQDFEHARTRSGIITIDPVSGKITAVADWQFHKQAPYMSVKDGPALKAVLYDPGDLSFDKAGNLFFIDNSNFCIRKMDTKGTITTLFGPIRNIDAEGETYLGIDYSKLGHEDGFGSQEAAFGGLSGIASAGNGKIYILDNGGNKFGECIREINPGTSEVATIIGLPKGVQGKETGSFKEVGGGYQSKPFLGLDTDFDGNLLLTRESGYAGINLFKADLKFENVKLVGGGGYETDLTKSVPANKAQLFGTNIAFDDKGNLYIGDTRNYVIRKIEREK